MTSEVQEEIGVVQPAENHYQVTHPTVVPKDLDVLELKHALQKNISGEVRFGIADKGIYSTDGSNYRQVPIGAVIPRTSEDVEAAVEVCRKYGVPIFARGCGTSLSGQTCNVAVVFDFSKYMHRILEIDPDRKVARVQPGLILDDLRIPADRDYHLTYGPDPSTHNRCTFGGMIGNNSCGVHSVMAGRTVDNVEELEILTYDGLRTRVRATRDEEYEKILAQGGRKADIYRRLRALRDKYAQDIRHRYPRTPRRSSGYALDELLPEHDFHVARSLVGSQSTCALVLEATVRLVYSPPAKTLVLLGYPDVYSAGDHVMQIMECQPIGLEGLDEALIRHMIKKDMHPQDAKLLPEGKGWLMVEFGGASKEESDAKARRMMDSLQRESNAPSMKLFDNDAEEHRIWEVRESGLGATAFVPGEPVSWTGWEDAAVPPERVGEYLRDFRDLLKKYNYQASLYGHFGQGCIHCRISFDLFTPQGIKNFMSFLDDATTLVARYGGSFSAEHGDGQAKAWFLPKMYGQELISAFREYKRIWDPDWKMNPGKEIDPYRPDQNLRLRGDWRPWQPKTHFRFPNDHGSLAFAALRCVGVGLCRRTHPNSFMCPSFLVTREEEHTTRGRARLLFEMIDEGVIKRGWRSKAMLEALDLCLACKACKSDCPVNVDMATYKAEFLSHHYAWRIKPRAAYSMGLIQYWARLGGSMPRLANFIAHAPVLKGITKSLGGISHHRSMPTFAHQSFSEWFYERGPHNEGKELIVLYPDIFNDYFFPRTLKAATLVLEHWGYHVMLPPQPVSGIRPLVDFGMLNQAKRHLQKEIQQLNTFVSDDVPVIFLEPSTCSIYRDELPNLFPDDENGKRLTRNSHMLEEYAWLKKLELPKLEGRVIFHGHCHQKAVLNAGAARDVIQAMGLTLEEPQMSCCGMAGSFGFEERHYDISMAIGEQALFPAVRQAGKGTMIVADGFSCRTQIMDGAKREPMHMSELLLMGFQKNGKIPAGPV